MKQLAILFQMKLAYVQNFAAITSSNILTAFVLEQSGMSFLKATASTSAYRVQLICYSG